MLKTRAIARIDVKNEFVIKGIHLEGLRKVGDPNDLAKRYYNQGIDEIIFMDAVAAYYDRNSLSEIIDRACNNVFVPITVGGGIRAIKDIQGALRSGADKVAINTMAIKDSSFVSEASKVFGAQCIVASIDAKRKGDGWEAYYDNGREPSGKDAISWAIELERLGAGEIVVTSIDMEGTKKGFDTELMKKINGVVNIPVIACGGGGKLEHLSDVVAKSQVSAVAVASILHYGIASVGDIKDHMSQAGIDVRGVP